MNAGLIRQAISIHPVFRLAPGDIGHTGVAAALTAFREAWSAEFRLRGQAADDAGRLLQGAAGDTERVDALLAQAAARMSSGR